MPHRIEERDGLHVILISGEITAAESRERFRLIAELLQRGPALILLAYGQGSRFLAGPGETMQLQLSLSESIGDSESGAIAFLCPDEVLFGICRQFQLLAAGSRIKLAVFRDGPQAEEWLADTRKENAFDTLFRY